MERVLFQVTVIPADEQYDEDYDIEVLSVQAVPYVPGFLPGVKYEIDMIGLEEAIGEFDQLKITGTYVWEGTTTYSRDWDGEYDCEIEGDVRVATPQDIESFAEQDKLMEEYENAELEAFESGPFSHIFKATNL